MRFLTPEQGNRNMFDENSDESVLLKASNLTGYYRFHQNIIHAVEGCDLNVRKGDTIALVGESGCGKSTLGKMLMGYCLPPLDIISGSVIIDEKSLYNLSIEERRRKIWGRLISRIPQYSMNSLNPVVKIKTIVMDFMKSKAPRNSTKGVLDMAKHRFEEVGLSADVLEQYPFELSGGMKQRVVVILSSLLNPKVLIADEPTTALDVTTQRRLIEFLRNFLEKEIIQSLVFISHDIATLSQICKKFYIMYAGEIVECGDKKIILSEPLHPYTKLLLSTLPIIEKDRNFEMEDIPGFPPDLNNPPAGCRFRERCSFSTDSCNKKPSLVPREGRFVRCWLYE